MIYDLEQTTLFKDVDFKELEDIAQFCSIHTYGEGDFVLEEHQGRGHFDLFVLRRGQVEVVSNNSKSISGEVVLSREDKELFGEVSWLTKKRRTASVRCRTPVEVIRIDGEMLDDYIAAHPRAGLAIMRHIAQMLAERLSATDNLLKQILWNTGI